MTPQRQSPASYVASPALVVGVARALDRIVSQDLVGAGVIAWSSPIVAFGDPSSASLATLGINPSNREFVDELGAELDGPRRRFHTLVSLGLKSWSDADARHVSQILQLSAAYFSNNPYDGWFKPLDGLISGTGNSYYGPKPAACHLDLIPFATVDKWTLLSPTHRTRLLQSGADILGSMIRDSSIETLILNGRTVVSYFEQVAGVTLKRREVPTWRLRRTSSPEVAGHAFTGLVRSLRGLSLERDLLVLGFNHNLQSSFGLSADVTRSIRDWLRRTVRTARLG